MNLRPIWPALLSIAGTSSAFLNAFLPFLPSGTSQVVYYDQALPFVSFFTFAGCGLLAVSIGLLADRANRGWWGALAIAGYALLATPLILFPYLILSDTPVGSPRGIAALAAIPGPILGLVGSIWGLIRKSSFRAFRDRKPFWPALLCLAGTAGPFMMIFAPFLPSNLFQGASGVGALFILFLLVVFLLVVSVGLFIISLGLFLDSAHKRVWGALALVGYGLLAYPLVSLAYWFLSSSSAGTLVWIIGLAGLSGPILGLIGSVWGVFWNNSPRSIWPAMRTGFATRGPLARPALSVFVGALSVTSTWLFSLIIGDNRVLIGAFLGGPILLIIVALLLYLGQGNSQLLGGFAIAVSALLSVYTVSFLYSSSFQATGPNIGYFIEWNIWTALPALVGVCFVAYGGFTAVLTKRHLPRAKLQNRGVVV